MNSLADPRIVNQSNPKWQEAECWIHGDIIQFVAVDDNLQLAAKYS